MNRKLSVNELMSLGNGATFSVKVSDDEWVDVELKTEDNWAVLFVDDGGYLRLHDVIDDEKMIEIKEVEDNGE